VGFAGSPKTRADDVLARPKRSTEAKDVVLVPDDARRGPVVAFDAEGEDSEPSEPVDVVTPRAPKSSGGPIATAVTTRKAFFDGARKPTLSYVLETQEPAEVLVQVVRERDGVAVRTFDEGTVEPGERHTVAWNGKVRGKAAPDGRYAFVVLAQDESTGLRSTDARQARGAQPDGFTLLGHRFPIRGKHSYGSEGAMYGGGRGHQGVDVFAECGTPLVAARGGIVKMKKWQDRAGNYVVIDGAGTDVDYAYMHLQAPALVEQRERVRTGQLIGYVGDTGRAFGCHLHFEEWSGPGWYTGGSPFDPLPDLQAWDAVS
jgi:murein DD-endopeptidase MepM/ murein hydrolase activator NlpD